MYVFIYMYKCDAVFLFTYFLCALTGVREELDRLEPWRIDRPPPTGTIKIANLHQQVAVARAALTL